MISIFTILYVLTHLPMGNEVTERAYPPPRAFLQTVANISSIDPRAKLLILGLEFFARGLASENPIHEAQTSERGRGTP